MTENESAPAINQGTPTTTADHRHYQQSNYNTAGNTPSPDQLKRNLDDLLNGLPPDLRPQIERAFTHAITQRLTNGNGLEPGLEALLPRLHTIQSNTILEKEYPPIPWIVPDYLPPGLSFLAGKPKVGKSWMALQLSLAVMTGGKALGKDVCKGKVLYLALEDSERRLKNRMLKQSWPITGSIEYMLLDEFQEQIGALNSGGGKRLLAYIESNKYRLVIVDTFSRAIKGDQLASNEMIEALSPLQQYALKTDVGLLFIHHMPKGIQIETDPIGHLYGSVAISGIADTVWALYKEPRKYGAKISISGRDVDGSELKLTFDRENFYWNCEGDAQEIELTERRKEILDALKDLGKAQVKDIAEATGQQSNHVFERLQTLASEGFVTRIKEGSKVFFELTDKE